MKSKIIYSLPISQNNFIGANSNPIAHVPGEKKTEHAVDFPLLEGTEILAAADGKVILVFMESNEGGNSEIYKNNTTKYTNKIYIQHSENEFSKYAHLKFQSNFVKKGDLVKRGQVIALSGNTGYSSGPHLHFHVMRVINKETGDWETVDINWDKEFEIKRN